MTAATIGHGGRMDAIYARQRHFYDATRKFYLLGRNRLIRDLAPPPGGTVLEIGCGTGRNLIAAARLWPDARYHGIDISTQMLATARANIARAIRDDRITTGQGDAAAFDPVALFGIERFDRVFLSYTLSMIPDWRGAIAQAAAALAPDGRLAIVDFGQQEQLPRWWRSALFAWLDRFDVTPRADLFAAIAAQAATMGAVARTEALFGGYAWSGRIDAAPGNGSTTTTPSATETIRTC